MAFGQVDGLGKDIARLADWAHNVVCFLRFAAAEILYLVQGLIEGRAYEVGHAGIYDGKLLGCALFYIEGSCDE